MLKNIPCLQKGSRHSFGPIWIQTKPCDISWIYKVYTVYLKFLHEMVWTVTVFVLGDTPT
jgi:hypothetical protein